MPTTRSLRCAVAATRFSQVRELLGSTIFRLSLMQAAAFAVSISLLVAFVSERVAAGFERQLDQTIRDDLTSLVDEAGRAGIAIAARRIELLVADPERNAQFFLLVDPHGRRLAGNAPAAPTDIGWFEMPLSADPNGIGRAKDREHVIRGRAARTADGSMLLVGRDIWAGGQLREAIMVGFVVCLAATVALAVVLSLLTSLAGLRRIQSISRTSREIMTGDLDRRVPVSPRGDEFDSLAIQLNLMLDRIQTLMEDIGQVTNDVAHDLRTPLARLRQRLETARRKAASTAEYATATDAAIEETDAILDTFTAMLRIAQIESGTRRAGFTRLDLTALLESLVETYSAVAEDRGQSLIGSIEDRVSVVGDRELIEQLFVNLIENALTHTPSGTRIVVALHGSGPAIVASVADNGAGIPSEMHSRMFQRFMRMDAARSTPGSGIGLASVAAIARLHETDIQLQNNHPGLRVVLRFTPAANA